MEGNMKKKCMMVVWSANERTVVLPKIYKYIVRYFFIKGDHLCYNKTKKDKELHKPHKMLVDLTKVVALHVFETKMEVVEEGGNHIVLKTRLDEIKKWVPALASRLLPKMDAVVACVPPLLPLSSTVDSPSRHLPVDIPIPPRTLPSVHSHHSLFPLSTEFLATPPYYPPIQQVPIQAHPMLRKLPSVRSNSSLSFTLTSKQCINWFGTKNFDDPDLSILTTIPPFHTLHRAAYQSYGTGSPIAQLGWDDWDAIFTRFQRNEEAY